MARHLENGDTADWKSAVPIREIRVCPAFLCEPPPPPRLSVNPLSHPCQFVSIRG